MSGFDVEAPLPGGHIVLEASAGTGKTFSLAHLVLRLVAEEAVPIDRIVVVTFTNAATGELRDRIRTRLRDALGGFERVAASRDGAARRPLPESLAELGRATDPKLASFVERQLGDAATVTRRLRMALADFDRHRIQTIHGFCERLLARHALETRTDFGAALEPTSREWARLAAYDFHALLSARHEPALEAAEAESLSVGALEALVGLAVAQTEATLSLATPDVPPPPPGERETALERMRSALAHEGPAIERWFRDVDAVDAFNRTSAGKAAPEERLRAIARWVRWPEDDPPKAVLHAAAIRSGFKKGKDGPFLARLGAFDFFPALTAYLAAEERRRAFLDARVIACLHEAITFARDHAERDKRRRRVRGYDDLLRAVRDALAVDGADLRTRVARDLDVALIDEFQDTDPVQWDVFRQLFDGAGRRLMLIGDPKQAIYGFRGADLHTYFAAREAIDDRRELGTNHRSDARLVEALEWIYGDTPDPFASAAGDRPIAYSHVDAAASEPRLAGGPGAEAPVLVYGDLAEANDASAPGDTAEAVARLLGAGTTLRRADGSFRPLVPGDCAVLVRRRRDGDAVREALRSRGIDAVMRSDESVYVSGEATELALVLRATLDPGSRRALASAVATDLVSGRLASALDISEDEGARERWHAEFTELGRRWASQGFSAMFRHLLARFDPVGRFLAVLGGGRRVTNLLHLGELLATDAERHHLGREGTLTRLLQAREDAGSADDARKLRLETDAHAVEIVTMHASKGLEWPVVFCDSLGLGERPRTVRYELLRSRDAAPRIVPIQLAGKKHPDVVATLEAMFAEEHRIAYVALTRARHQVLVRADHPKGTPPLSTLFTGSDPKTAAATLADKVRRSEGRIAIFTSPGTRRTDAEAPPVEVPDALPFTRAASLDDGWRVSSYTALSRRDRDPVEDADAGRDDAAAPPDEGERTLAESLAAWDALGGGAAFGTRVHTLLEHARSFDVEGLRANRKRDDAGSVDPLVDRLAKSLATPIALGGPTLCLRDLPLANALREVDFRLPVAGGLGRRGRPLDADALAQVFRDHDRPTMPATYAARVASLSLDPPLAGYLVGSLDLLFEFEGRIYVADYKTTRLGSDLGAYATARLPAAMAEHDYLLQVLIYALAAHRLLRGREPDYRYAQRFGGVLHLFLRGMDGAPGLGVYVDRPPVEQIEAFERALGLGGDA